jgi:capsular polysaccharide biosynthesis protein
MEARRYLAIVRRRLVLIVAIVVAALAAGWLITPSDKSYTATATLYVGSQSIDPGPDSREISGDRVHGFDRLITTFTNMLDRPSVAEAALDEAEIDDRTVDDVTARTTAEQVPNANLIEVSVTDPDPAVARALANAMATTFEELLGEFEQSEAEEDRLVTVYETAKLPEVANSSPLLRNLILSLIIGLVVAGGVVALLEHLDISLRSRDDVERHLGLPVLGTIPALGDRLPVMGAARIRQRPVGMPEPERGTHSG